MVKMTTLDTPARAVSYAPDGDFIVVGLGGDEKTTGLSKKDGAFVILNEADLTIVYEAKDAKAQYLLGYCYLHGNSGWVVTPGVCQIGYMDHPGCHQLNVF